jgi:hypothetical protein
MSLVEGQFGQLAVAFLCLPGRTMLVRWHLNRDRYGHLDTRPPVFVNDTANKIEAAKGCA